MAGGGGLNPSTVKEVDEQPAELSQFALRCIWNLDRSTKKYENIFFRTISIGIRKTISMVRKHTKKWYEKNVCSTKTYQKSCTKKLIKIRKCTKTYFEIIQKKLLERTEIEKCTKLEFELVRKYTK